MAMEAGAPRGAAATTSGGGGGAPEAGAELGSSGAPVTWGRVWRAGQEAAAHALLLCFTALLALKLDGLFRGSWWMCGALMPGHGETMTDEAIWERLPGTPSNAKFFPLRAVFLPILLLQVTTVSFAIWIFFERLVTKLRAKKITDGYISISSKIDELFMMMQHGSRLIAWWSIDEDSKEEEAHLCYANNSGACSDKCRSCPICRPFRFFGHVAMICYALWPAMIYLLWRACCLTSHGHPIQYLYAWCKMLAKKLPGACMLAPGDTRCHPPIFFPSLF
uniref:Uncharacterized protein n=1 Tax=Oryza barthii TaxID=65489 RepID=A0A0D3H6S4_9ORYZ